MGFLSSGSPLPRVFAPVDSEEALVRRARQGEADAMESLVERYHGMIASKAKNYYLAGADVEDVYQEGCIGLCKAVRDFRQEKLGKFRPFAELCVTRQILSAVTSATRYKHMVLSGRNSLGIETLEEVRPTISDRPSYMRLLSAEDRLLSELEVDRLSQTIADNLSELEQSVLFGIAEGQSYKEMSCNLSCTTKVVDNALQRARRKMLSLLVN